MTNQSINIGDHSATNNWQQIGPDLEKMNKLETFARIKPIFLLHYEQFVEDCCNRIDVEFGLQLGKIRQKLTNDQYIKQLEYVRLRRKELKQNYMAKVSSFFEDPYNANDQGADLDLSKASLNGEDAIKENHAINLIIRQCEHSLYEELISLNRKFAFRYGKQTIADSQNPVFPERLIRALAETVSPFKINADAKIALYKTFEAKVFKHLGFIYGQLMIRCESPATAKIAEKTNHVEQRVAPLSTKPLFATLKNSPRQVKKEDEEQPSAEFKLLQKQLDLWRLAHSPSAYDLISTVGNVFYEHTEIKSALQALHSANVNVPEQRKQPLKRRVVKKIEEQSYSIDARVLPKHDEDILDLVALIFNEIERDELLQPEAKAAILQLELPMAAASLGKYSVFISQNNPFRLLLDELFASEMFLNPNESDDQLIHSRILGVVRKLTDDNGFELSGWSAEADEFVSYMSKQKQRSQRIEQNARQHMEAQQGLVAVRKTVAAMIDSGVEGKKMPLAIAEFLRDVWAEVLMDAHKDKNEQPELWQKSVQAMDDLIKSVVPPANENERKQILKLLPGLLVELKSGLKRISYDKSERSRFFKELAIWHIILTDKNETAKAASYIDKDNAAVASKSCIKIEAITDECSEQAENLALESWVAFSSQAGKQWAKLSWKDVGTKTMLFVGKNGAKLFEIQADELAEKLRNQQAAIAGISNKTITERMFSNLMGL